MVTLDVKFTCDSCKKEIIHSIRVGQNFFLGADNIPNGWIIETGEYFMKAWCPEHAMLSKGI